MTASNQMIVRREQFMVKPTTFQEIERYCTMIAKSSFCPKAFQGKVGDVIIAIQMGSELGLSDMQALQNIAVINGKPCIYGDAALAVVIGSPSYECHNEGFNYSSKDGSLESAYCTMKRRGSEAYTYIFSVDDAKKAKLWTKPGVWQEYPARMLQMRARGFAMRDKFADALRGINIREEVEDYNIIEDKVQKFKPTNHQKVVSLHQGKESVKTIEQPKSEPDISDVIIDDLETVYQDVLDEMKLAHDLGTLQEVFRTAHKINFKSRPDLFTKIIEAKDVRKEELTPKTANTANNEVTE